MKSQNTRIVAKPHPRLAGWYVLPGGFETTEANVRKHGYAIEGEAPLSEKLPPKPALSPTITKLAASPPSAAVLAERDRAQNIIALAPIGAEVEAADAIRTGMTVESFRGVLAGRAILEARRRAFG